MAGQTKQANFSQVNIREVDFVTRFNTHWHKLQQIMGIMRPIRKAPGTKLISYHASMVDSALQGGASVAEGATIPFTTFQVTPKTYGDITIEKYAKAVTIEAVAKYGATIAVQKTDAQFLTELQKKVMNDFFAFLKTGTLKGSKKTWQEALAIAKGAVLNKFSQMNMECTEVVGFANIMDLYKYLGGAPITVQTQFGLSYVKDFLGYGTLFLLDDTVIPKGTVIALPVENIDLYYIDPADSEFGQLGLEYTTKGETHLIGFHAQGNYTNATGECYALMGMKLWAEYLDGICIVTVGSTDSDPAVATA